MLVQDTQLGGVETDGGQAAPAANAAWEREPEGCAGHSHHIWKKKEVAERSWRTPYVRYTCTTLLRHFFLLVLLGLINNP